MPSLLSMAGVTPEPETPATHEHASSSDNAVALAKLKQQKLAQLDSNATPATETPAATPQQQQPEPPVQSEAAPKVAPAKPKSSGLNLFAAAAASKAPAEPPKRGALYGTGLTKRVLEKAERTHVKQDAAVEEQLTRAPDATPERAPMHVTEMADHQLPDNLMDDAIVLDEYQERAMALANEQFGCLIGAAGTGKTTVTKQLVRRIIKRRVTAMMDAGVLDEPPAENVVPFGIAFCSFTGKAVQQMKRALPEYLHPYCDTIHGTLGYAPVYEEREQPDGTYKTVMVFRPTYNAINKLNVKAVVVDESGMCPIHLFNELNAALPEDCQIILVGDINQLPPVQGRSVLGFAMLEWPTYTLEKVHRTAEDSAIIHNAHRILEGKGPMALPKKDFFIQTTPDGSSGALAMTIAAVKQMAGASKFNPIQDALIVPQNVGNIGQEALNKHLVHHFNPPVEQDGIVINPRVLISAGYKTVAFAEGDKVMLHQNDRELGLTNGMMGVITSITVNPAFKGEAAVQHVERDAGNFELTAIDEFLEDYQEEDEKTEDAQRQASHIVMVKFQNVEDQVPFQTAGAFNVLTHAYAFTCHKAQGSEFPTVILLLHSANMRMLCREWLYTAVTRAQGRVVILCNNRGLQQALRVQRIKGKTVAEKARAFIALMDKQDTSLPDLRPACHLD